MEFSHVSVLLNECIKGLNIKPDGVYVDGTLGGAGHGLEICKRLSEHGTFIGVDRDKDALEASAKRLKNLNCKIHLQHNNYADIKDVLRTLTIDSIDGALLDLGVSSFQLDTEERGFSYMQDAPLDMRMNQEDRLTAMDIVNGYSESDLFRIIKDYGEEKWAKRIAKFIVAERNQVEIKTTSHLVNIIKNAIPAGARKDGPHPAKRTFQAIRIEVNQELEKLRQALEDFCDCLSPGGRLAVITFHSLEDRIVKEVFNRRVDPCICPKDFPKCTCGMVADVKKITKKPILPNISEIEENPRSRSAKLRIIEKLNV